MTQVLHLHQSVYKILGFDGLNFVSDIIDAVPQDEHCRILGLLVEGDGIRVNGRLMVQVNDVRHLSQIDYQLKAIRGLVSLTHQTN